MGHLLNHNVVNTAATAQDIVDLATTPVVVVESVVCSSLLGAFWCWGCVCKGDSDLLISKNKNENLIISKNKSDNFVICTQAKNL